MSKHTFEWENGTKHEFEDFEPSRYTNLSVYLPSNDLNKGKIYTTLLVKEDDYNQHCTKPSYNASAEQKEIYRKNSEKIRVGILGSKISSTGMPAGIYLPFKFTNNGLEVLLDGLLGDFIFNEKIKGS